jgi:hypothetical protein
MHPSILCILSYILRADIAALHAAISVHASSPDCHTSVACKMHLDSTVLPAASMSATVIYCIICMFVAGYGRSSVTVHVLLV